jgi:hypothetical protein
LRPRQNFGGQDRGRGRVILMSGKSQCFGLTTIVV